MTSSHEKNSSPAVLPALLTLEEAAKKLRVSKTTLYRLVDARALSFYKVGRSLRFSEDDLTTFLATYRIESLNAFHQISSR